MKTKIRSRNLNILIILIVIIASYIIISSSKDTSYKCVDCNIILISIDTLRADHLGTYGYFRNTSPNIDKFSSKSIVFENAFANSVNTAPSHMSIFTGMYPKRHGVISVESNLSIEKKTLTEILGAYNYKTVAFVLEDPHLSPERGYRGFESRYSQNNLSEDHSIFDWFGDNYKEKFFVFLHLYEVHDPYMAPENYNNIFDPDYKGPLWNSRESLLKDLENEIETLQEIIDQKGVNDILNISRSIRSFYFSRANLSDQNDIDHLIALYDEEILYTDNFIELVLDEIDKLGISDNTIIIVTSDHGEEFTEHGEILHEQLYDETIHVPLIIRNPRAGSRRIEGLTQSIDIVPTILDFLDIPMAEDIQGESLVPLIEGKEEVNDYVYANWAGSLAIRNHKWKLIKKGENIELYDLENDPEEQENVIELYPNITNDLENKLLEWDLGNLASPSVKEKLDQWEVSMEGAENFEIQDTSKRNLAGSDVTDITASGSDKIIKIRKIQGFSEEAANSYISDKKGGINSLFISKPAPYPGVVTKVTQCPEEFHPGFFEKDTETVKMTYYDIYANDRFVYGICSPDLIEYRAILAYVYCKNIDNLFEVEIFTSAEDFDLEESRTMIESFSC